MDKKKSMDLPEGFVRKITWTCVVSISANGLIYILSIYALGDFQKMFSEQGGSFFPFDEAVLRIVAFFNADRGILAAGLSLAFVLNMICFSCLWLSSGYRAARLWHNIVLSVYVIVILFEAFIMKRWISLYLSPLASE